MTPLEQKQKIKREEDLTGLTRLTGLEREKKSSHKGTMKNNNTKYQYR